MGDTPTQTVAPANTPAASDQSSVNPVVQNYLNDNGVDYSKRAGVISAMKAGQSADSLAQLITQKYGSKYSSGVASSTPAPATPPAQPGFDFGKFIGDVSSQSLNLMNPIAQANNAMKAGQGIADAAGQGLQQLGSGAQELAGSMANSVKDVVAPSAPNQDTLGKDASGVPIQGPVETQNDKLAQDAAGVNQGFNKVIGGGLATATSPISGALNALPDNEKVAASAVGNAPNALIGNFIHSVVGQLRPDLSKDYIEQNIVKPFQNAAQVGMIAAAPEGAKAAQEAAPAINSAIEDSAQAAKNIVTPVAEAAKAAPEAIGNAAQTVVGNAEDAIKTIGKTPEEQASFYKNNVDKAIGQITQGKTGDLTAAKNSLSQISTDGVKSYQDLSNSLDNHITALKNAADQHLATDSAPKSLDTFDQTFKSGKSTVTVNPVKDALAQLQELYTKINDPESLVKTQELAQKAQTDGLTHTEVNNLARQYGNEFGQKAFNKMGDPLTSVNAQSFENTRTGIKDALKSSLPDQGATLTTLDKQMSDSIKTKGLIDKMVEKANALTQKVQNRGLGEKIGGAAANLLDAVTGGAAKGFLSKLIPRNVGLKTMNSLDLQGALSRTISNIDRWSTKIDALKK